FHINIQSQNDFSELLKNISLEKTELHFNTKESSTALAEMLLNECEVRKAEPSKLYGTFGYDLFSIILKNGRLSKGEELIKEITKFCSEHFPKMKPFMVNGDFFREAESTIVQELGYALATGSEYLAMSGKKAASLIEFNFSTGSDYFPEIAKLRAARKLWPQVLKAYKADETSMSIHG